MNRYHRQQQIEGWSQQRLRESRVVLLGANWTAQYAAVGLASLGIGALEIYSAAKEHPLLLSSNYQGYAVSALAGALRLLNSEIEVHSTTLDVRQSTLSIIGTPDLVIATQRADGLFKYCTANKIPLLQAEATAGSGTITRDNDVAPCANAGDEPVISAIIGGMLVEESRKVLMPLAKDSRADKIMYSTQWPTRFGNNTYSDEHRESFSSKRVLVVGAGGLGNPVVITAALAGIGNIIVLDKDTVDSTNLNRQFLFYDAVGKNKAPALAQKVCDITGAKVQGYLDALTESSDVTKWGPIDAIVDCVDSFATRAIINYHAIRNKIPLVSGGTNPRAGQVAVYVPGKTSCLDCRMQVEEALAQKRRSASCAKAPDPSVIMTNMVVGGLMVRELLNVLDSGRGTAVNKILKYDAQHARRGGLVGTADVCSCTKPEAKEWLASVDAKYALPRVS